MKATEIIQHPRQDRLRLYINGEVVKEEIWVNLTDARETAQKWFKQYRLREEPDWFICREVLSQPKADWEDTSLKPRRKSLFSTGRSGNFTGNDDRVQQRQRKAQPQAACAPEDTGQGGAVDLSD